MRRAVAGLALLAIACASGIGAAGEPAPVAVAELRAAYSGPPATWPRPWLDPDVAFVEMAAPPLPLPPGPEALLGERLFSDPRLSADGRIACASCHDPTHGFSVPHRVGRGIGDAPGRRNPPALHGVAGREHLDWDGRGTDLAARLLAPLTDPHEMGGDSLDAVLAQIAPTDLGDALARLPGGLSSGTLARALAAYLATIDGETRLDRFIRGDAAALDDTQLLGLHLFRTRAGCANCHFGPQLSDGRLHNLRLSFFGEPAQDLGRHGVTGASEDAGRFRTPSLRHARESAPYMHNGLFPTLTGVVNLYDRGGGEVWARNAAEAARPLYREAARLAPHIRPLGLTPREKAALVAFLDAL